MIEESICKYKEFISKYKKIFFFLKYINFYIYIKLKVYLLYCQEKKKKKKNLYLNIKFFLEKNNCFFSF
jgi:hypothetical protein